MPIQRLKPTKWTPPKLLEIKYSGWKKGLNTLLRETEIEVNELSQMDNLLLIGSGVPTKRWGSDDYFLSGATGYGRALIPIKDADSTIEVLSMTDWGILTKKSGASYAIITGASWASGYNLEGVQLANKVYLVNGNREMVRYDFSTLQGFPTLAIPTNTLATNFSGATGLSTWSWRITAMSKVGETLGSTAVSLASLPQDLSKTLIHVSWTAISAASGDLTGYNIYRGHPGDEVWVGGVSNETTRFDDFGIPSLDSVRILPTADTTGGVIAKFIIRFQDRLIMAGIPGEPTKVIITARAPFHENADWSMGGGDVFIEPNSGDEITGLATYQQASAPAQQTIIVFKERSVWELRISSSTFGTFPLLDAQYRLLTASQGCSSHRSIKAVENDIMFANRSGIYILRYEPQLLNVINANELSAKIRPFFEAQTDSDHTNSTSDYFNKKYVLSYPTSKKTIIFDRERLSFVGPMITPFGINRWASYLDSDGIERWIAIDSDDQQVSIFQPGLSTDKGTAIRTVLKTRKESFGDWSVFKTINEIYSLFRNVQGSISVNIYLEERSGACYSDDTEVLTKEGWKLFKDVNIETDLFATRNQKTKTFEWQKATYYHKEQWNGDFYHFSSRSLDLLVSPNHRILYTATAGKGGSENEYIKPAEEIAKMSVNVKLPATSNWKGVKIERMELPIIRNKRGRPNSNFVFENGDDFMAFMGMYLAEGCYTGSKRTIISQKPQSKGFTEYKNLLLKILGKEIIYAGGTQWRLDRRALYDYLVQFGKAPDKWIPKEIMNATPEQIKIFLHYYILGDGWIEKNGRKRIKTTSKKMADQLQELIQKIGFSTVILVEESKKDKWIGSRIIKKENQHTSYTLELKDTKHYQFNRNKVHYKGKIYCVSVPNEILYVRRNNKPIWCGNTITAKSFTITSNVGISGMGTDQMGLFGMGLSENSPQISSDELPKATLLYKNARTIQFEITTTGTSDNYELLNLLLTAHAQPRVALQSWKTS